MKSFTVNFLLLSVLSQYSIAFTPTTPIAKKASTFPSTTLCSTKEEQDSCHIKSLSSIINRHDFLSKICATSTAAAATTMGIASNSLLFPIQPSYARGRATLEFALDRYYPRIEAGGVFYANDLKKAIETNDWRAIKVRRIEMMRERMQSGNQAIRLLWEENIHEFRSQKIWFFFFFFFLNRLQQVNHQNAPKKIKPK